MKKEFNTWVLMNLSKRELFIGLLIFIMSGVIFRFLGKSLWRDTKILSRSTVTILRPKINELTIDEFNNDLNGLTDMMDGLNNDFLSTDKNLMNSTARFRNINKEYLELRLRLNHIALEIDKGKFKYSKKKINDLEDVIVKIKDSLDLLSDELKRETDEAQSYTLSMLTLLETIFLPLGVLTGYFGMNFSSMGGHVGKGHVPAPGIFGLKYGQTFVMFIMLLSTALVMYLFYGLAIENFSNIKEVSDSFKKTLKKRGKSNSDLWDKSWMEQGKIIPFNVNDEDLRKLRNELLPPLEYNWSKSMEPGDIPERMEEILLSIAEKAFSAYPSLSLKEYQKIRKNVISGKIDSICKLQGEAKKVSSGYYTAILAVSKSHRNNKIFKRVPIPGNNGLLDFQHNDVNFYK